MRDHAFAAQESSMYERPSLLVSLVRTAFMFAFKTARIFQPSGMRHLADGSCNFEFRVMTLFVPRPMPLLTKINFTYGFPVVWLLKLGVKLTVLKTLLFWRLKSRQSLSLIHI